MYSSGSWCRRSAAASILFTVLVSQVRADAPCTFGITDVDSLSATGRIRYAGYHDDSRGNALFVSGHFDEIGGVKADSIARWNGASWEPLGDGLDGWALAMATFDDGRGPALYVAGQIRGAGGKPASGIARWDGTNWERLPGDGGPTVLTLAVFDDGGGQKLYVGGDFRRIGDLNSPALASWDGTTWSDSHGQFESQLTGLDPVVGATVVDNRSNPPRLVVGGTFARIGDVKANGVAAWDGTTWAAFGDGLRVTGRWLNGVGKLDFLDFGSGERFYAAGAFYTDKGTFHIAQWSGEDWIPLASADDSDFIKSVEVFGADGGPPIWVGGIISTIRSWGEDSDISVGDAARWDGQSWSAAFRGEYSGIRTFLLPDPYTEPRSMLMYGSMNTLDGVAVQNMARYGCLVRGDVNCDQLVTFDDIDGFVQALTDQDSYRLDHPACDIRHADVNSDGTVDFGDINGFVDCLVNGCR